MIEAENRARRDQIARCKPSKPGRPVTAEQAKLAEMKPFRKPGGPAPGRASGDRSEQR